MHTDKTVLVTGAAGYIGSHTCVELLSAGYDVVAIDNLCNGSRESLARVERIAGRALHFYQADVRDRKAIGVVLNSHRIDAAIHFAGLKSVDESLRKPLTYFDNNVCGTSTLLQALSDAGTKRFVFSSSATVYGVPEAVPISETAKLSPTNPYGRTKLIAEQMLGDLMQADPSWAIGVLRYFNPAGAHPSGLIGEDPHGIPNNLMPFIAQVAVGRRERLKVFGNDYPTPDGTGVRDFIHVVDLAQGHVAALARLFGTGHSFTVNLGTGRGYSVLEVVHAFATASGVTVPYEIAARRLGDVATCYSNPSQAEALLDWKALKGLEEMCLDHWHWQNMNPDGYAVTNTESCPSPRRS